MAYRMLLRVPANVRQVQRALRASISYITLLPVWLTVCCYADQVMSDKYKERFARIEVRWAKLMDKYKANSALYESKLSTRRVGGST